MSDTESDLFQPVRLGPIELRNRVVMAPLTRSRAGGGEALLCSWLHPRTPATQAARPYGAGF